MNAENRLIRPDDLVLDPVTALLAEVRIPAASIATFALGKTAGIDMHGPPYAFIVLEGTCWLKAKDGTWQPLKSRDALLVLRGDHVRIAADPENADIQDIASLWSHTGVPQSSFQGYRRPFEVAWGGRPMCRMIGLALTLSRTASNSTLVGQTPPVIILPGEQAQVSEWAETLAAMLKREMAEPAEGFIALCAVAAQVLVTQMLRAHLNGGGREGASEHEAARSGIARLVRDLHLHPGEPWTIASMAKRAGMSRTSFIEHFAILSGTTPFRYLSNCRMDHAAQALVHGNRPVSEIAELSGYGSERGFRSAFTRLHGLAPLAYRKRAARGRSD